MDDKLLQNIENLKGVGEKRAKLLRKLGIFHMFDLICYFPRTYEDRSSIKKIGEVEPDESICIRAMAAAPITTRRIHAGLEISKTRIVDETGGMTVVFFNQKHVKDAIRQGETYVFYGKIVRNAGKLEMQHPIFEKEGKQGVNTGRIIPIYPLTAGLSRNLLSSYIRTAIVEYLNLIDDPIPEKFRTRYQLAHLIFSYRNIHYPEDSNALKVARRRLIYEELLIFSIGLGILKGRRVERTGITFTPIDLSEFYGVLPFQLTGAQKKAINDAVSDMQGSRPMNRLVQGDVGSGKTMVAAVCAYHAAKNGYQTAIMAPTEILAQQHMQTLAPLFHVLGIHVELLTGGCTAAEKREIKAQLADGSIDIIIGTHALLTNDVLFLRLGLVITDEQHRFGVGQRSSLTAKGENPHLLVMSATPIPRTLALILYGDLDISVIDELPPGRKPIQTVAISDSKRGRAYGFIRGELAKGRQAYIVCPLVEENDVLELKSVESFSSQLAEREFAGYTVAFLHGKMKAKEKDVIMRRFAAGEIQALVSTTVIEVGVNVPNATVMVVENAERFGLSQLHQLRGRVGRGAEKSYCILFSNTHNGISKERLQVLCNTNDGFVISEEDLRLRGPGDFFGTRQHGVPDLKIADLVRDMKTLKAAQDCAGELLREDSKLCLPEHTALCERVKILFRSDVYGDIFN